MVDLQGSTCLTYLSIEADEDSTAYFLDGTSISLKLPSVLQALFFCGKHLFGPEAYSVFGNCLHLSTLALRCHNVKQFLHFSIPLLPSSVCNLHLGCSPRFRVFSDCNWQCLQTCTNLEHLELHSWGDQNTAASAKLLSGELEKWVTAAKHLHTVSFGLGALYRWRDQSSW